MRNKILGVLVCTLLITATVLQASGKRIDLDSLSIYYIVKKFF